MPERISPTYRVFISSTFDDFVEERSALEGVWDRLDEFCKARGARFEAIDLRWGISKQAAEAQRVIDICLDEVRRCVRLSPRPNFLVLVGERYGWEPLPTNIPEDEFTRILSALSESTDAASARDFLLHHYRRDGNALPPSYVLQPVPPGTDWPALENRLRQTLREGAIRVFGEPLPPAIADRYCRSAVHLECIEALTQQEDSAHVLACLRASSSGTAAGGEKGDTRADRAGMPGNATATLREYLLSALPHENVFEYGGARIGGGSQTVSTLCDRVGSHLEAVIEQQHESRSSEYHAVMERLASGFRGREEDVGTVLKYVDSSDEVSALCVVGSPGIGKTALLAHCGRLLLARADSRRAVIFRSVGATPRSARLDDVAGSILDELHGRGLRKLSEAEQAAARSHFRVEVLRPYQELLYMLNCGGRAGEPEKAHEEGSRPDDICPVIFIDGFDQLASREVEAFFRDAEREIAGVCRPIGRVVMSFADDSPLWNRSNGLSGVCMIWPEPPRVHTLHPVSPDAAGAALTAWLSDAGRQLTPAQHEYLLARFAEAGGSMLYLRLATEASRWWADTVNPAADAEHQLPDSVGGLTDRFICNLGEIHGPLLVRRACEYIATAREGLDERELLAALRSDRDVTGEYRRQSSSQSHPQVIAPMVWARLFGDIEPYLGWFRGEGGTVLRFFHRVLHEHIARTVGDPVERHAVLSAVFDRQASLFENTGDPSSWQPNGRKAVELLTHLAAGDRLRLLAKYLQDFDFLVAKCCLGTAHVAELLEHPPLPLQFRMSDDHAERVDAPWPVVPASYLACYSFLRQRGPTLLRGDSDWGAERLLVQCAVEEPEASPVRTAVESWIGSGHCTWPLVRGYEYFGPPSWMLEAASGGIGVITSEAELLRSAPRVMSEAMAEAAREVVRRGNVIRDAWQSRNADFCFSASPRPIPDYAGPVDVVFDMIRHGSADPERTHRVLHLESQVGTAVKWLSENDPTVRPGLLLVRQEGAEQHLRLCDVLDWVLRGRPDRPFPEGMRVWEAVAPLPGDEDWEVVARDRDATIRNWRGSRGAESEGSVVRVRSAGFLPSAERVAVGEASESSPFVDSGREIVAVIEPHELEFYAISQHRFVRACRWMPQVPISRYAFTGDGILVLRDVEGNCTRVWVDWTNVAAALT